MNGSNTYHEYPKWMYGPNGEAAIFEREEDIPEGWKDHPNKFKTEEKVEEVMVQPVIIAESEDTPTITDAPEVAPEPQVSQEPAVLSAELTQGEPSTKGKKNGRKGSHSNS